MASQYINLPASSIVGTQDVTIVQGGNTATVTAGGALTVTGTSTVAGSVSITEGGNTALVTSGGALTVVSTGSSTVSGTVNTNLNGLNNFQTSQYTVGTSAVQLTPTPLSNRSSLSIKVITTTASDIVYVGNSSGVTASTGYFLFNGDSIQLDLTPSDTIYAIGTSPGQIVAVMELGE